MDEDMGLSGARWHLDLSFEGPGFRAVRGFGRH